MIHAHASDAIEAYAHAKDAHDPHIIFHSQKIKEFIKNK